MKEKTRGKSKLVQKLTPHIQKTENIIFSFFGLRVLKKGQARTITINTYMYSARTS